MIDLAELNDIKRCVSTGPDHEKIKAEVLDALNMEITNLTILIESGIVHLSSYRTINYPILSRKLEARSTLGALTAKTSKAGGLFPMVILSEYTHGTV